MEICLLCLVDFDNARLKLVILPELAVPILMSIARECDFPLRYAAHAWPEEAAAASGVR
jgi:hypothetical protein